MGTLTYSAMLTAEFDDRLLAHLQIVMTAKLRRGESFTLSYKEPTATGDGRTIIWLHSSLPLAYTFSSGEAARINRLWIEALMVSANSPGGLQIVPEPGSGDVGSA